MIGVGVTRSTALHVLRALEDDIIKRIREAAAKDEIPGHLLYGAWVHRQEEQLATIEALRALVEALPPGHVLAKAEEEWVSK